MDFPPHPFWDFALDVYRRPGVGDACLTLQERYHLDVNLLLFACWIGASGRGRLSADEIGQCIETVRPWHDAVVRPLRGVRRLLKDGLGSAPADLTQALRRQIQAREIDAEHVEQLMLSAAIDRKEKADAPVTARAADAGQNVLTYFAGLGVRADAGAKANLAAVLCAAFPDVPVIHIRTTLEAAA